MRLPYWAVVRQQGVEQTGQMARPDPSIYAVDNRTFVLYDADVVLYAIPVILAGGAK
jgi:hypothetical protein